MDLDPKGQHNWPRLSPQLSNAGWGSAAVPVKASISAVPASAVSWF